MKVKELKRLVENYGIRNVTKTIEDAGKAKKLNPYNIKLKELAEVFLGGTGYDAERKLRQLASGQSQFTEANEAVDASAFSAITGQLLITIVKEKYNSSEFIGDELVKKYPNPPGNMKEHKIPVLSDVKALPSVLSSGELYPFADFGGSQVEMPAPERRGLVCAVTLEMLLSDLTGQAQDSAASVGRSLGYDREQRILRVVLGITNPYKWSLDATSATTSYNTYVDTATTTAYVNKKMSNTIANHDQINDVEQLFYRMIDPVTGRSIYVRPTTLLCSPEKEYTINRILNATSVRSGDITTGDGIQVESANPLKTRYKVYASPIARALLDTETALTDAQIKERVYIGDFQKAFGYREVAPLQVVQAPPNNSMEFMQDIVLAIRASEYGCAFVFDPRYAAMSTNESPS